MPAGRWPGSSRCSNGPTTCSSAAPSWPGSWPRPSSPGLPSRRWSSGIGINVAWPGPPEAGGTCLDELGGAAEPLDRRRSSSTPAGRPGTPVRPARGGRRAGAPWPTRSGRRCATLGQQVRVTLAGEELSSDVAARHRRRRPAGGRDGRRATAGQRRRRGAPPARPGARKGLGAWANIGGTMRLLVTGGAGFIGSNFARYWVEQHPEDHVVVYDVLTYAGNRPSLSDIEDRIVFVQGDICDSGGGREGAAGRGDRHDRPLRRRVAQLAGRAQPGAVLPDERPRHPDHARGGPPGRRGPLPPRLDLRGLRGPAPRHRRGLPRGLALPAPHALQRLEGRGRPRGAGLCRDLRAPRSPSPTAPTTTARTSSPRS